MSSPTPTSSRARAPAASASTRRAGRPSTPSRSSSTRELDIALLHVDGLQARSLTFAEHDPERGALGATLGYPGGGALTILPAAVAGRYPATGHDIYGTDKVRRQILELRAGIDRGDSGGPLVLEDGSVGGVVFAEARTNADVGYALSATEVAAAVEPDVGATRAVDTGACVLER